MSEGYAMDGELHFPPPFEPYSNLIINAALTGVLPRKEHTPHVPISPAEVVADAVRCCDGGAAIVHIHARDEDGSPTYDPDIFAHTIKGIRQRRPALIICATTSGRRYGEFEQRSAVLDLEGVCKPDMASLTTGSLNFPDGPSVNHPDMVRRLAERMKERGIKPELEVLELGMINTAKVLARKGIVVAPYYFNILMGSLHTMSATMLNVAAAVHDLPNEAVWSFTGLGKFQLKINMASMLMGGHVRVGVEDNIYYDSERTRLCTNLELVQRIVRIASELERQPATPMETRRMLDLPAPRPDDGIIFEKAVHDDVPAIMSLLETANMHYVPSEEMPDLGLENCYVARQDGRVVGMCGFKMLSDDQGKTTLMVVAPDCRGKGLGLRLQRERVLVMADLGARTVITNADRPETIEWYKKHFGYREVGHVDKTHEFGLRDVGRWTTLEMDVKGWLEGNQ